MSILPDGLAILGAILVVVWTALPVLRHETWWIRGFDFPRLQVAAIGGISLTGLLATGQWQGVFGKLLILLVILAIAYQLARSAKYTPLYPRQVTSATLRAPERTIGILVANVLTPNRNARALLDLIAKHDPDIVLAVETDEWWQTQLDALDADYPHSVKHPLDNLYGMHLYSRLALKDSQTLFLVQEGIPSIHAKVLLPNGHAVDLHCLHPAPPSPTENATSAERDAELLVVAKSLNPDVRSTLVIGDLNDVAWSDTTRLFQKISGLLDPRIGRGMFPTFHADYPLLRWPLDYVFCSGDFRLVSLERLGHVGSDHFPIFVKLQHDAQASEHHETPRATRADKRLAQDKIDQVPTDESGL